MTNILSIVRRQVDLTTRTNEDWLDGWLVVVAGSVAVQPDDDIVGNGVFGDIDIVPSADLGTYRCVITNRYGATAFFAIQDLDGTVIERGVVGSPVQVAGMSFTLSQGSTPFIIGDAFTLAVEGEALNLAGIRFEMQWRRPARAGAYPATVQLSASTAGDDPWLLNGASAGTLTPVVPQETMSGIPPGQYAYDVLAIADGYQRVAFVGTVTHEDGVTRPAS